MDLFENKQAICLDLYFVSPELWIFTAALGTKALQQLLSNSTANESKKLSERLTRNSYDAAGLSRAKRQRGQAQKYSVIGENETACRVTGNFGW